MKKVNIVLICAFIALLFVLIGIIIGINIFNKNEKDIVGTYKTNTWNGKEAVIVLQKDKTMICPNGSGIWYLKDEKLYIEYDSNLIPMKISDNKGEEKLHVKQEVLIVEGGLMYNGHFFENVNKK